MTYILIYTIIPEYIIEKYVFDCFSPEEKTSIPKIRETIKGKVKEQAKNIVLNLTDSKFSPEDIMYSIYKQEMAGLDRIIKGFEGDCTFSPNGDIYCERRRKNDC